MPQIECTDVTLAYERGVVLRDLSFTVERGDYLCIVGENGSGKSTLAKALLGLKAPLSGRIVFDETLRRRGIGYLPQQSADRSDFPASVWEVTLSGRAAKLGLRPFYTSADKESALQSLRRLGIEGLKKQPCSALSGGQRQRVLLARALCAGDRAAAARRAGGGAGPGRRVGDVRRHPRAARGRDDRHYDLARPRRRAARRDDRSAPA